MGVLLQILAVLAMITFVLFKTCTADAQDCKFTKIVNQKDGEIVNTTTDYKCETPKLKIVYKPVVAPQIWSYDNHPLGTMAGMLPVCQKNWKIVTIGGKQVQAYEEVCR